MKVIEAANVNGAFARAVDSIRLLNTSMSTDFWRCIDSRGGREVYEYVAPVATVYLNPWRRVLFSPERDANPFFHLMEALWMLGGRDDAEWISQFSSNIAQFAEDDGHFHGAYGARWRSHFPLTHASIGGDQLEEIVSLLRNDPSTRRAVLAMWDPTADLLGDGQGMRDHPCNTHVYFKVRDRRLHMTVCCRSNDIFWGCYGANAVHFSVLQEFLSVAIGVGIGTYTHVSDSWHCYVDNPTLKKILAGEEFVYADYYTMGAPRDRVGTLALINVSLDEWLRELDLFLSEDWNDEDDYEDVFFKHVALPMRRAWLLREKDRKVGNEDLRNAIVAASTIRSPDWRAACTEFLRRRAK